MAFTFFFRDLHTLDLAVKYLLPFAAGSNKVKIWDAGCAMGQEPYTLAILLAEAMGYFAYKNVHIDATDIDENDTFGEIVKNGIYQEEELKRIPEDIFRKYFKPLNDGTCLIDDRVKSRLAFHKSDLLKLHSVGNEYSLVVCKNVLLHFQHAQRIEVIKMFHKALLPGGFMINEQTQQLPSECNHLFEKVVTDANLYRKI